MTTRNSYDDIADYLTDGYWEWRGEARRAFDVGPGGVLTADITDLNEAGQQLARWALEAWAGVSGIVFEFVEDDNAQIIFDDDGAETATRSTVNDGVITSSHVNIPAELLVEYGTTVHSFSFTTYLHEIGHALGLGNPGPYPDPDNIARFHHSDRIFQDDSYLTTVMSSFYPNGQRYTTQVDTAVPVTPMIADIIAIQNLYGPPPAANAGDTVYGFDSDVGSHLDRFFSLWAGEENPLHGIEFEFDSTLVFADLDADGDPDLVVMKSRGRIDYYENTGTVGNADFTQRLDADNPMDGIDVGYTSMLAFADLDGDNDLDLLSKNSYGDLCYFENIGTSTHPGFTECSAEDNPLSSIDAHPDDDGFSYLTVMVPVDLDTDGDIDLIFGQQDGDIDYYENTGTATDPVFTQRIGAANPFDHVNARFWGKPAVADADGDNDPDLIVMEPGLTLRYFENTRTPDNPGFTERTGAANPFEGIIGGYDSFALVDLDGDQDIDLVIAERFDYSDYYENTGTRTNPDFIKRSIDHYAMLTLYDSGGNDTLDLRTALSDLRIDLNPEQRSDTFGSLAFAPGTLIENVTGGSGNDHISGNMVANRLVGGPGNDTLIGNDGDDALEGGAGADRLEGGIGTDLLEGGAHNDVLVGGQGVDTASYRESDAGVTVNLDTGRGHGGHAEYDFIFEVENVRGSAYGDTLTGDNSANRLDGAGGDDELRGGAGNDVLEGGEGADVLEGGADADVLKGGAGADRLVGGSGFDWVSYQDSDTGVTVNLDDGTAVGGYAEGDIITGIENVRGSAYRDVLVGDDSANRLYGDGGDDELRGNGGNDVLEGSAGADSLDGGTGMDWASYLWSDTGVTVNLREGTGESGHAQGDTIAGIENLRGSAYRDVLVGDDSANHLYGYDGADELRGSGGDDLLEGNAGADRLDGGSGIDRVSYLRSDMGVTVNLDDGTGVGGHAEGDIVNGIENVTGSAYRDVLVGDDSANHLEGIGGDDELRGGNGDDVLDGGAGADELEGGAGADRLDGGAGVDTISYRASKTGVTVNLEEGTATGDHAGGDAFYNMENVRGSAYGDKLVGDSGANRLDGAGGDDELRGGAGNDMLEGGAGADDLEGGAGADWLSYEGSDTAVSVRLWDGQARRGHAEGDTFSGIENLRGSAYGDLLSGDARANRLEGGAGNDQMWGGSGDDLLEGGAGADRFFGGPGADWVTYRGSNAGVTVNLESGTVEGGHAEGDVFDGIENLSGSAYADILEGDGSANNLSGDSGDDELRGNGGNDMLEGGAGADRLVGGAGADWVSYEGSDTGVTVNLRDSTVEGGHAQGDVIVEVENVVGSNYGDVLVGDDGPNRLEGISGDDELQGSNGEDVLDGGAGVDTVSYQASDTGVTVNLEEGTGRAGHAEGDVIVMVENVTGSAYGDELTGDNGVNRLEGAGGDDVLRGGASDDVLEGGPGDDELEGGAGADQLIGGAGEDWASYEGSGTAVTVSLFTRTSIYGTNPGTADATSDAEGDTFTGIENLRGSDYADVLSGDGHDNRLAGGPGDDELEGRDGYDILQGDSGDDYLSGSEGNDTLYGGGGNDSLQGGRGSDRLEGGDGNDVLSGDGPLSYSNVIFNTHDVLIGGAGNDILLGGNGNNLLIGGEGADIFFFGDEGNEDVISDFTDGEDRIDLTYFNLSGFAELTISSDASGVTIDLTAHGGGTILLEDFDIADLDAFDFFF